MDYNITTLQAIAAAVLTIAATLLGARWQRAKNKLSEIRQLVDSVDDAVYDDKVTEEEFRTIYQRLTTVVRK